MAFRSFAGGRIPSAFRATSAFQNVICAKASLMVQRSRAERSNGRRRAKSRGDSRATSWSRCAYSLIVRPRTSVRVCRDPAAARSILGADRDTLRRVADRGNIEVFTTPGAHRRFLRASIDAMFPRPRQTRRQSLSSLGEPPDRIAAEFRRRVRTDLASQEWHKSFDEESLRWFRERGMRMSEFLLGHLDTTRAVGREQLLAQAEILG